MCFLVSGAQFFAFSLAGGVATRSFQRQERVDSFDSLSSAAWVVPLCPTPVSSPLLLLRLAIFLRLACASPRLSAADLALVFGEVNTAESRGVRFCALVIRRLLLFRRPPVNPLTWLAVWRGENGRGDTGVCFVAVVGEL
ncbi:hypothetical protein BRADI_3g09412v3 [Brachypodium distachyon]|uniref:Uncharacterized protein n=1 Tax=Brachypodium distachyon TaxID=15368 RepID=A0A0Q3HLL4_BRADI|nr:hypothetical protein BRADI_3g09412v3 [Brachypodium distachyon]